MQDANQHSGSVQHTHPSSASLCMLISASLCLLNRQPRQCSSGGLPRVLTACSAGCAFCLLTLKVFSSSKKL